MANQVSNFQFQNNALRVIVVNGEPWFLAADVCRIIGITSPTKAVKILDDDEVALKTFQGLTNGNDEANFISESGMYKIVMRSQDAIKQGTPAHAFTKWVTSEVLPAIRKTGSYSVSISKAQQGELATLIAERFPSGKDRPYAWSRFNNHFRLASYKDLPASRFEEACQYIRTMQLLHALPSPSSSMKPVVWTRPDGYVGPKWENRGIPRDDRAIKQIIFELTQWGRENLPKGEVANSFEDAIDDLRQLQITCWTHIDEALSGISRAAYMLHKWQARNGRIGNAG